MDLIILFTVALASIFALSLGKISGEIKRRSVVRGLKKDSTHVPAYGLLQQLQPLELELLLSGQTTSHGIAGQLVQLNQRGHLEFDLDGQEILLLENSLAFSKERDLLFSLLARDQYTRKPRTRIKFSQLNTFKDDVEIRTISSLQQKDWDIAKPERLDRENPPLGVSVLLIGLALTPPILLILLAVFTSTVAFETLFVVLQVLGVLAALMSLVGVVVWVIHSNYRNEFNDKSAIIGQVKKRYRKDWEEIQRLYHYFKVSGADQFTPSYKNLNLTEMDDLYPYWVAMGFDEKIVKIFK